MNMKNKVKHYAIVMMIGVILNLGLYYVAHVFHLPMWIDSIGTAYVAVALEPAAGLLVAFATNFYQAAVIYDSSSLIYYMVSALAALAFGIILRKDHKVCWKRLPLAMFVYFVSATMLASLLTIWRTAGIPDSGWERFFYEGAINQGVPNVMACFFGTAILKVIDTCIIAIVLPIIYNLTPIKVRNNELFDPVSIHNSYWKETKKL